jgi:excinuclease UvrABC helicase subunit UvrB
MIPRMETEMRNLAKSLQFEEAAKLRDRIKRIKALSLGLG